MVNKVEPVHQFFVKKMIEAKEKGFSKPWLVSQRFDEKQVAHENNKQSW
jgi:hypothetical protein